MAIHDDPLKLQGPMTSMEQELNGVVVTLLYSISSLQAQCADQNYLLADRLPGLTTGQRRALRSTSQTFRSLAERTKEHAKLIRELLVVPGASNKAPARPRRIVGHALPKPDKPLHEEMPTEANSPTR